MLLLILVRQLDCLSVFIHDYRISRRSCALTCHQCVVCVQVRCVRFGDCVLFSGRQVVDCILTIREVRIVDRQRILAFAADVLTGNGDLQSLLRIVADVIAAPGLLHRQSTMLLLICIHKRCSSYDVFSRCCLRCCCIRCRSRSVHRQTVSIYLDTALSEGNLGACWHVLNRPGVRLFSGCIRYREHRAIVGIRDLEAIRQFIHAAERLRHLYVSYLMCVRYCLKICLIIIRFYSSCKLFWSNPNRIRAIIISKYSRFIQIVIVLFTIFIRKFQILKNTFKAIRRC